MLPFGALWFGMFPLFVLGIVVQVASLLTGVDLLHSPRTPTVLGPVVMFGIGFGATFSACVIAPAWKTVAAAVVMGILFAAFSVGAVIAIAKGVIQREQVALLALDCVLILVGGGLVLKRAWAVYGFRS